MVDDVELESILYTVVCMLNDARVRVRIIIDV